MDGEKELALAVLERAYMDASGKWDNFDRQSARNFLCGRNSVWKKSLIAWCDLAKLDYKNVMETSRKKWG